ncbi:CKLF-like MARVEL transmembrane domain-containing protein 7 isoform X2 [Heptranchias perlo]|uniref:CKLF-like MARVEL transmembrane domain-containing protein 7 isoform X2 n=1 Tax=Heptranchias perlo TaxID=212740 RepID=UPI00355A7F7F
MAETTTTTTTTITTGNGFIDRNYARSFSGILKIVQAIVVFIAFLCIRCSDWTHYSTYRYFEVVTIWFLVMVLIFYIIYLTRLHLKITCMHWPLTEFLHYVVATILLLIASIVGATKTSGYAGLAAGVKLLTSLFCSVVLWLCINNSVWYWCLAVLQDVVCSSTSNCCITDPSLKLREAVSLDLYNKQSLISLLGSEESLCNNCMQGHT